ncbi:hypothetical protein V2J09_010627 [Rumex salicifolius]
MSSQCCSVAVRDREAPGMADTNTTTRKRGWSKQEDEALIAYVHKHGEGCWSTIAQATGLDRCGKSCRLRWKSYLKPGLKRGNFDDDEDDLIIKLHALLGNRWSLIAGRLPGRTGEEVKNHWNTRLRRELMNIGVDPNNHRVHQTLPRSRKHYHTHEDDDDDSRICLPDLNLEYEP